MARRSILLLIAVMIAAIGTTLIVLYVRGVDERAKEGQELVEVLVATDVIEAGETIEEALQDTKVSLTEIARDSTAPSVVSDSRELDGQVALERIYPGEQIIRERFGAQGEQDLLRVPEGEIAIAVELSDPARVAGFVPNGAHVAIFVSLDPVRLTADGEQKLPQVTRLLLEDVVVLATGSSSTVETTISGGEDGETTQAVPQTILTIAVTQDEAEKVIYAARNGDLTFAYRDEDSQVDEENTGVEAQDVTPESFQ